MARIEDWPSYQKEAAGWEPASADVRSGQPISLPGSPQFDRFYDRQRGALALAIARSRNKRAQHGGQGFGFNRQNKSQIEARINWWRKAIDRDVSRYKYTTREAADVHFEPDWDQMGEDLSTLQASIAVELYRSLDRRLGSMANHALDLTPVDSGLSAALIGLEIDAGQSADEILQTSLYAGAGYYGYIQEPGYKIEVTEYINRKGNTATRRKRVYKDDGGLPPWKAKYLVQNAGGGWVFDAEAYERAKAEDPFKRPAEGKPWRDLFTKPATKVVRAVGKEATENAVKGAP
jgi:hypothetical protein